MLWNLPQYDPQQWGDDPLLQLTMQYSPSLGGSVRHELSVTAAGTSARQSISSTRFACYLMLTLMPEDGLPEVCSWLKEAREFYSARASRRSLPSPAPQSIQAHITGRYERAPLDLTEE